MRKFKLFLGTAICGAAVAFVLAGGVAGIASPGAHYTCASGSGHVGGYGTAYVGPNWTHVGHWSSDNNYYAQRKDTSGNLTYNAFVPGNTGLERHFDLGQQYRYTGLKNANGVYSFWYADHMRGEGDSC